MKATLIAIILILPCFVFGQSKVDDYGIYSNYLRSYQQTSGEKINYVIRVSSDHGKKYGKIYSMADAGGILDQLRGYVKGDSRSVIYSQFKSFLDTLKRDTLWLPLFAKLDQSMQKRYIIKNKFANDLQVSLLTYNHYVEYFKNTYTEDAEDIEEGWASFHEDYPGNSLLINLSPIACDGRRAVFYLSHQCNTLCGEGDIVLFYKDSSGWRLAGIIPVWYT